MEKNDNKAKTYLGRVRNAMNVVLKWVFPPRCPICDDILPYRCTDICDKCRTKLHYIKEPRCVICGKEIRDEKERFCYDCSRHRHFYLEGCALWEYECVSDSIFSFKNRGRREYADFYAKELTEHFGERIKSWNADALIPVPLHKSKLRRRGYNQAEVLAKELERRLHIPVESKLIARTRKTSAQKHLHGAARENNVKKSFHICQNDVKLKTIIIIDDVYTTGSTIDAVAYEFQCMGIQKIYFVALAIGRGR